MSPRTPRWMPEFFPLLPSMAGKTVVITGTTSGIGLAATEVFLSLGARVVALNRSVERAKAAIEEKLHATPPTSPSSPAPVTDGNVPEFVECDLASFDSVRAAAREVTSLCGDTGIDVLCCNAGVMGLRDVATTDGYDIQMQVNHLSHFLLTSELFPLVQLAAETRGEARIFQHSSNARKVPPTPFNSDHLRQKGGDLGGEGWALFNHMPRWERYHQSKLANCLFTFGLQAKLAAVAASAREPIKGKIKAVVAHPGTTYTPLLTGCDAIPSVGKFLAKYLTQHPMDGAMPLLAACCLPDVASGTFYGPKYGLFGPPVTIPPEGALTNKAHMQTLWELSEQATSSSFSL